MFWNHTWQSVHGRVLHTQNSEVNLSAFMLYKYVKLYTDIKITNYVITYGILVKNQNEYLKGTLFNNVAKQEWHYQ